MVGQSGVGRVALILGGAGEVGEGIVRAFLSEGWRVIVPSRSEVKLDALRQHVGEELSRRLETSVGDISDPEEAERLRDRLRQEHGELDAIVASVGGWWQGARIVDASLEDWHRVFGNNLTTHFVAAKTLYRLLKQTPESCYLFINGSAAQEAVPMSGLASIFAAGQLMLKDVLAAEEQPDGPRANTLMINTPVRSRSRQYANADFLTADEVGRVAEFVCSPKGVRYRGQTIQLSSHIDVQRAMAVVVQ